MEVLETEKFSNESKQEGSVITNHKEFELGQAVVYGLNGRCNLVSVQKLTVDGKSESYYKLEPQKMGPSNKTRKKEMAIWIPVESASEKGLRPLMSPETAETVFQMLETADPYFEKEDNFQKLQTKLEACMVSEGPIGLAKALSYLEAVSNTRSNLPTQMSRFRESIHRVLTRELAEVLGQTIGQIEEKIEKLTQHKAFEE